MYKNGVLDSINTITSNKNFNGIQKMHYDNNGNLTRITSTGKYFEYTDVFTYDNGGMTKTIQRKYKDGQSSLTTSFDHRKNVVTEVDKKANGDSSTKIYVYNGDELFATISGKSLVIIRFHDTYHRFDFEVEAGHDGLPYVIEKRRQFQQDKLYLGKLLEEKNGKIVFDIPAISKNEKGDIIRQLQLDKTYKQTGRRMLFSKYVYADGTVSGSTDYDFNFAQRAERLK